MALTTTLVPSSTIAHDVGFDPNNFGTIEGNLSDGNDATYVSGQISGATSTRSARGDLTDLPAGVGVVTGTVINMRGYRGSNPGDSCGGWAGDYPNQRPFVALLTGSVAGYSSGVLTDWTTPAQINALLWTCGIAFFDRDGTQGFITEVSFDVTWNPVITGMKAFIFSVGLASLLGGGLLLQDMQGLALEARRRARTRIPQSEHALLLQELRDHRWPRYIDLGRAA